MAAAAELPAREPPDRRLRLGSGVQRGTGRRRFSGATRGASIGHVSPEAASGGVIGLVQEGDLIEIDIPGRSIHLCVEDAELAERRKTWVCPEPKIKSGYLTRYAKLVSSADKGAILQ